MGIIAKFSEGGNGLGGMSKTQNKVRIGQKNVQMLIKSEIQGFRGGIRTGKEKKFSEGGIGQGAKNFLQRGEQDREEKFSSEGEQDREPEIFCRGGIRTGKKIFSSDGGGEGGNVIKMRKFPDQGSSKLLWGRAPPQGGNFPPPMATYGSDRPNVGNNGMSEQGRIFSRNNGSSVGSSVRTFIFPIFKLFYVYPS